MVPTSKEPVLVEIHNPIVRGMAKRSSILDLEVR